MTSWTTLVFRTWTQSTYPHAHHAVSSGPWSSTNRTAKGTGIWISRANANRVSAQIAARGSSKGGRARFEVPEPVQRHRGGERRLRWHGVGGLGVRRDRPVPVSRTRGEVPAGPKPGGRHEGELEELCQRFRKARPHCGGSPCQSFSIAGTRTGLEGASGLMWEYVRAVREVRPEWVLWENVPGALSSSNGEDFRCLLEALDALGYGLAWRVLDAQFFGVAQRRERVFLVGRLGSRPPSRFCLSPRACAGILSRAERRGKSLPPQLEEALRAQASSTAPEARPAR